jgi:glyoxylase-like metal-dependent hydrolase (beta-lactamase superfamily II)
MPAALATALNDASPLPVPAEQSFPGSSAAEWRALSLSGLDDDGCFSPSLGCFLVRWREKLVLCDAGIGPGPNVYLGGLHGRLPQALRASGVVPGDIDTVIFTHLHMDHIGWATSVGADGRRVATFANAEYIVAQDELAYWLSNPPDARPHHREAFDTFFRPLADLGRLTTVLPGAAAAPGVSFLPTPGHTPGHCSILFGEGSDGLVVTGDVFHAPGQIERPDWPHRADMDPDLARQTRKRFIAQAAESGWSIAAGHFREGLSFGRIVADAHGYRFSVGQASD